jgi:hypothetical protein
MDLILKLFYVLFTNRTPHMEGKKKDDGHTSKERLAPGPRACSVARLHEKIGDHPWEKARVRLY